VVLERQPQVVQTPKAGGIGGQILQLLRYRGLLDRFEAASTDLRPALRFPFGGMQLDFTHLADPPLRALSLPQAQVERLLDERARELGAEIRRGHEMVAMVSQNFATVTVGVRGPDGPYQATARFLVGCDGPRSRVRDLVRIPFPGTTYPEVNRLGHVTVPDSVTQVGDGDSTFPGWAGSVKASP
jgi:2-polyprenyl-6-methoxyphenol hydroxylase-like FAD-dependent oxidoreductase